MPTFRMLGPALYAGKPVTSQNTHIVNGRAYTSAAGAPIDMPDMDAHSAAANGWIKICQSGPTAQRPGTNTANGSYLTAGPGTQYFDTGLAQIEAVVATNGATATSSPTLNFAAVPASVLPGMSVYDATNGNAIGTVQSVTPTTVTLAANAAHAVASGDVVTFSVAGRLITFDGQLWRDVATGSQV